MKRKILTAAVAAATLAAGSAQAVIVGHGGTALLVPYVEYDTAGDGVTNTMVQITVGSRNVERQAAAGGAPVGAPLFAPGASPMSSFQNAAAATTDFPTLANADPDGLNGGPALPIGQVQRAIAANNLHWYFFDASSTHLLDDDMVVSANDMALFDWGGTVQALGAAAVALADGVPGYLVFGSNAARSGGYSQLILWGDAMQINGNWESAAYIPVLPLNDMPDAAVAGIANCSTTTGACDEVTYNGSYPTSVNPFMAGMTTGDGDLVAERLTFDIPYFVPTGAAGGIGGETNHVIWLDQNYNGSPVTSGAYAGCLRTNWAGIGVEVFNTDETTNSAVVTFNQELNMIDVGASVAGARNGAADADGIIDAGFIWYNAPEARITGLALGCNPALLDSDVHGGVAFALVDLLGGNLGQVQTEMAHERGLRPSPAQP